MIHFYSMISCHFRWRSIGNRSNEWVCSIPHRLTSITWASRATGEGIVDCAFLFYHSFPAALFGQLFSSSSSSSPIRGEEITEKEKERNRNRIVVTVMSMPWSLLFPCFVFVLFFRCLYGNDRLPHTEKGKGKDVKRKERNRVYYCRINL